MILINAIQVIFQKCSMIFPLSNLNDMFNSCCMNCHQSFRDILYLATVNLADYLGLQVHYFTLRFVHKPRQNIEGIFKIFVYCSNHCIDGLPRYHLSLDFLAQICFDHNHFDTNKNQLEYFHSFSSRILKFATGYCYLNS